MDYQTLLKNLRPPEPSPATLWWMVAAVIGAGLAFSAFEIISRRIRHSRTMTKSFNDFQHLAHVCQLSSEEINQLKRMISHGRIEYPDRIFVSFEFFNECLEDHGPEAGGPLDESDIRALRVIRNKIFFGERMKMPPVKSTLELRANQWLHLKRQKTGKVYMAPVVEASEL